MINNKRVGVFLLIILLILFPAISFADAQRIFKENNNTVVVIVTYDKDGYPLRQGSGFIVREDGAIATNYHVINNAADIEIKVGGKVLKVKGVLHSDKENDIVILKAHGQNLPVVKLGDMDKANVGEKVYVISSPQGLENTISDGILSGVREIETNRKVLQITAPVSEGSSGGPVFNEKGEVIGIATSIIKEAQNLNFAMPINLIRDKILAKNVIPLKDAGIENFEKTAEYWFDLGYFYGEAGLYTKAIESYKQAIKIKPDLVQAHNNLGVAYNDLGMYKEAVESFEQVIRIKPDVAEAHCNIGIAYSKLGMYREEIESYKQAIRINPNLAGAHYNLGIAYDNLGMYKEAVESLKQAIRIEPDDAKAHYNLGIAYGKSGIYKEAVESLKQAIRIKPDDAKAHLGLGIAYLILNDRGSALQEYKILKDINPELAGCVPFCVENDISRYPWLLNDLRICL